MRNIPSLPPYLVLPDNTWEARRVDLVSASHPVSKSSRFRHPQAAAVLAFRGIEEASVERRVHDERRKCCRRIEPDKNKFLDTRSEMERRHYNRRRSDVRTNIEEDV